MIEPWAVTTLMRTAALLAGLAAAGGAVLAAAQAAAPAATQTTTAGLFDADFNGAPTLIRADTLTLKTTDRVFRYEGNVEVLQGQMVLTAQTLEGRYSENNRIETLTALGNVVVTKGSDVRATSQKALYEAQTETVTLTENPELLQGENLLTADRIIVFLREDRSTAEGAVRVKAVKTGGLTDLQQR